jgi:hypothetical protein
MYLGFRVMYVTYDMLRMLCTHTVVVVATCPAGTTKNSVNRGMFSRARPPSVQQLQLKVGEAKAKRSSGVTNPAVMMCVSARPAASGGSRLLLDGDSSVCVSSLSTNAPTYDMVGRHMQLSFHRPAIQQPSNCDDRQEAVTVCEWLMSDFQLE